MDCLDEKNPNRILLFGFFLLLFYGCIDDSIPNRAWKIHASKAFEFYPVLLGDLVLIPSSCNHIACIKAVDWRTGEVKWTYANDHLKSFYYNSMMYASVSNLLIPLKKDLICINTENGCERWQYSNTLSGDFNVFGADDIVYRSYPDPRSDTLYNTLSFNIKNGKILKKYIHSIRSAPTSIFRSPTIAHIHDEVVLLSSVVDYLPAHSTYSFIESWHRDGDFASERTKVYKENKEGLGLTLPLVVDNDMSFGIAHREVFCYDIPHDSIVWRTILPKGILTSRVSLYNDTLFIACEDEMLYSFSTSDGEILNKTKVAGTPSRLFHTTNDIWIVGGSDRLLYQLDRSTMSIINKYNFRSNQKVLHRTALITANFALLTDGNFWYSYPLSEIKDHLLSHK